MNTGQLLFQGWKKTVFPTMVKAFRGFKQKSPRHGKVGKIYTNGQI